MKTKKLVCWLIVSFGFLSASFAQKITGVITDKSEKLPIIGASIRLVGNNNVGTVSDIDGRFTLDISGGTGAIHVSYVGYHPQTIKVDASQKSDFHIEMEVDNKLLEEVVVVGYGTQKKENLTGAVGSVDLNKTIESRPITDVGRALQGAVAGLVISTTTGEIGTSPSIKIRGSVGSSSGSSSPMILVDNVVIPDLNLVNPEDIESISILKDAAASSIYGARAAFGVILITTKSKKIKESTSISYSNNFAWRKPTVIAEQLPGWQQAEINLAGEQRLVPSKPSYNPLGTIYVDETSIVKMKEWEQKYGGQDLGREMMYGRDFEIIGNQQFYYRTWDWYDMYYKDYMPQQTHNISINSGNEKTSVYIGLGYLGQEGLTKVNADTYDRYNASLGVNMKAYSWLDIRGGATYSKTTKETPFVNSTNPGLYDYLYYLYRWQPTYPYGTYNGQEFRSSITDLNQVSRNSKEQGYMRLTGGATFKILEGLTLDADLTYSNIETDNKNIGGPVYGLDFWNVTTLDQYNKSYKNYVSDKLNYVENSAAKEELFTANIFATYNLKLKKDHSFKFIVGSNIESSEVTSILAKRMNLYDPDMPELKLAYGDQFTESSHPRWSVLGFFGRINYDYMNRYLLEVNGRYDGSSSFPRDSQWGFFPSFSLGWRVSEESFMEGVKPVLSNLKLRGSYGSIGNQDVDRNSFLSTISMTYPYSWLINGNYQGTAGVPTSKSPILTWETVTTLDFGVDARFFSDKLGVTFDWYKRTTSNLLTPSFELPSTYGASAPKQNFGELQTPGWELAVDFNQKLNDDWKISVTGQLTDYYTKVTKWSTTADTKTVPVYGYDAWYSSANYYEGMRLGDIWGFKVDRLYQPSDFEADGKTLKPGIAGQKALESSNFLFGPGDVKYQDLDGNGQINFGDKTISNSGDKTIIGNIMPRLQYGMTLGLEYKDFDFNVFFQGVAKRKMWVGGNLVLPGYTSGEPFYKGQEDYWSAENPEAFYPRPTVYGQVMVWNYQVNDRYLLNMAYLRCKTLTLGYSLPKDILSKARISNLRVYLTAENLFEFTNLNVPIDPETGITTGSNATADPRNYGRSYPYQRTFSVGLQLRF